MSSGNRGDTIAVSDSFASIWRVPTDELIGGTSLPSACSIAAFPWLRSGGEWLIVDVAHVADAGGEATTAVDRFADLQPLLPGAHGVVYDTALRGVHHQRPMRELGWVSVNRATAAAGSRKQGRGKNKTKRIEKLVFVETKTVSTCAGEQQIRLLSEGGRVGLGEVTETGTSVFVPLDRVRTHRNVDKRGTYRWYNDYGLPEHLGGGVATVRLHASDEDRRRNFNRAENVRQIPPGDPDFETLYRRRNDAESINRHLEDTLWLRRAHSIGWRRQLLNLVTYALGVNALSMHVHRQGLAPPRAA